MSTATPCMPTIAPRLDGFVRITKKEWVQRFTSRQYWRLVHTNLGPVADKDLLMSYRQVGKTKAGRVDTIRLADKKEMMGIEYDGKGRECYHNPGTDSLGVLIVHCGNRIGDGWLEYAIVDSDLMWRMLSTVV